MSNDNRRDDPSNQSVEHRAREAIELIERVKTHQARETQVVEETYGDLTAADSVRHFQMIGRFQIKRQLGQGGFGVVFLAMDPDLQRQVAIKVPRHEAIATRELRERFAREGRAVASLSHPAIVPVFETGTDGPICYTASQYIPGQTLADYLADSGTLDPRIAARVTQRVAEAVSHAHQRGVLHRDIKPANIMVESIEPETALEDRVRLTDFGLARNLDEPTGETNTGAMIGTPAYMSPEQARGQIHEITTASDIYALGAVMYELLCGRAPFAASSFVETLDAVRTREPKRLRSINRQISVDLESICLKCLEKQPTDRYQSAAQLANDLQAWLDGRPVEARTVGMASRLMRWSRRNPLIAGLMAALVVLLVASTSWIWYERNLARANLLVAQENFSQAETARQEAAGHLEYAELNFLRARQAVETLLEQVGSKLADVPGAQVARREILLDALEFYQSALPEMRDDSVFRHETADAYLNIALIQQHLGQTRESNVAIQQAIDIAKELVSKKGREAYWRTLAISYNVRSSNLLTQKHYEQALESAQNSVDAWSQIEASAGSFDDRARKLDSRMTLALACDRSGNPQQAVDTYVQNIDLWQKLIDEAPNNSIARAKLAACHNNLGNLLGRSFDRREQAISHIENATKILTELVDNGADPKIREFLGDCALSLALWNRSTNEFIAHLDRAIDVRRALAESYPDVPRYRLKYSSVLADKARQLRKQGDVDSAKSLGQEVVAIQRQLVDQFPNDSTYRFLLANSLNNLGQVFNDLRLTPEAIDLFLEAIRHQSTTLSLAPEYSKSRISLAKHHANLALSYLELDDYKKAGDAALKVADLVDDPNLWQLAAQILSRCYVLARQNENQSKESRSRRAAEYRKLALALVARCVSDNRFRNGKNRIRSTSEFQVFSDDQEFLKLVQ